MDTWTQSTEMPTREGSCSSLLHLRHSAAPPHGSAREAEVAGARQMGGLAAWQICKLTLHIEKHLADRLVMKDLAKLCRLSGSRFHRAFKTSFCMTPYNYILQERMRRACYMLAETDLPLSQISLDCGMADQSHLSNIFRRRIGITPNRWRKMVSRNREFGEHADLLEGSKIDIWYRGMASSFCSSRTLP